MFKMPQEVSDYFRPLKNNKLVGMDFDIYYYCTVLGMAKLKRYNGNTEREITRTVPNKYSQDGKYKEMLLSLINAEVRRTRSNLNNRNDIKILCNSLLDTTSSTNLTDIGAETLNSYCMGGYVLLKEANITMSEPRIFFEEYLLLINQES